MPENRPSDDLYGIESAPRASVRPRPVAPAQAAPPKVIAYQPKREEEFDPEKLKNLHAPLALFAVGLLVQAVVTWWHNPAGMLPRAFQQIGLELVVGTALMLIVFRWCASHRGFDFGKWSDAVLKVLAISVGPSAVIDVLGALASIPFGVLGLLGAWIAGFCLYFALIGYFFDLDQDDTWYCVIALFLTRLAVSLFAAAVLAS